MTDELHEADCRVNHKKVGRANEKDGHPSALSQAEHAWRLSNTMDTDFCIDALEEALDRYGEPDIFNSDQGSQYTSKEFSGAFKDHGTRISMDGKGAWRDNVFVEKLWRSVKYEEVYLNAYTSMSEAKHRIGTWIAYYNSQRKHQTLGITPVT
jgi:putative transposase